MKEKRFVNTTSISQHEIQLAENNEVPKEVQLLRTGKFSSFFYGEFEITQKVLQTLKKNFDDKVTGGDLMLDYSHNAHDVAAAWIKDVTLKNDDNELWLSVEWTPKGKQKVMDKEFRYLSAEYDEKYKDNESKKEYGHVLLGGGLTNRPFIKGMKPVTKLSEAKRMEKQIKELTEKNVALEDEKKLLSEQLISLTEENKKLSEKVENQAAEIKTLHDEKIMKEKVDFYNKLLSEKKVLPAQKDAILSLSIEQSKALFENAKEIDINTDEVGDGKANETKTFSVEDLNEAAMKLSEEEKISVKAATSRLLESDEYKHLGGE